MSVEIHCECGNDFDYDPDSYEDGDENETECDECGNTFTVTTSVTVDYEVESGFEKDKREEYEKVSNDCWKEMKDKYPDEVANGDYSPEWSRKNRLFIETHWEECEKMVKDRMKCK